MEVAVESDAVDVDVDVVIPEGIGSVAFGSGDPEATATVGGVVESILTEPLVSTGCFARMLATGIFAADAMLTTAGPFPCMGEYLF